MDDSGADTNVSRAQTRDDDRERIARLLREAFGSHSPVSAAAHEPRESEEDQIFRELFSRVLEGNRSVIQQVGQIDREALVTLYTSKSFSSPEAMGRATRAVRQLLQINRRAAAELLRAIRGVKGQIRATHWSERDKEQGWKEIQEAFAAKFGIRSGILKAQRKWAAATVQVYELALAHSHELRFEGKIVRTTDPELGREFGARLRLAKQHRNEFRTAMGQHQKERSSTLADLGLNRFPAP